MNIITSIKVPVINRVLKFTHKMFNGTVSTFSSQGASELIMSYVMLIKTLSCSMMKKNDH